MICSRTIYKGEDVEVSIPFLTTGWTSLYVEYFTYGDTKVVRQEDELGIDEYTITATFSGDDLDLLDDGVLYYTIHYVYDDENYIKSSNTPYVLKTPAGYDAKTEDEVYEAGYEAGLEDCSGSTPCDCTSAVTEAYQSGYTAGESDGYHEGEVVGKAEGYTSGYTDGYNQGQADCPECDCSSAITEAFGEGYQSGSTDTFPIAYQSGVTDTFPIAYQSGYTDGYSSGVSACSCVLETKTVELTAITQTIQAGNNARPIAPSGQTVYGGSIEEFENYIQVGDGSYVACYPNLYYYEDANHTTEIEIGHFMYGEHYYPGHPLYRVGYYFYDAIAVKMYYFNYDFPQGEWVDVCGGNLHFLNDGVNLWFYGDYNYGMTIRDSTDHNQLDINDLLFETVLYDGMKYITVDASDIYNQGYQAGLAACQGQ